jgi:hypothetical protein
MNRDILPTGNRSFSPDSLSPPTTLPPSGREILRKMAAHNRSSVLRSGTPPLPPNSRNVSHISIISRESYRNPSQYYTQSLLSPLGVDTLGVRESRRPGHTALVHFLHTAFYIKNIP